MTRPSIAALVARHNELAVLVEGTKLLSAKTSLTSKVIATRIAALETTVAASTDTVSLVDLCKAHDKNAKSIRARFRTMYADPACDLPKPVSSKGWEYAAADVARILPHVTR